MKNNIDGKLREEIEELKVNDELKHRVLNNILNNQDSNLHTYSVQKKFDYRLIGKIAAAIVLVFTCIGIIQMNQFKNKENGNSATLVTENSKEQDHSETLEKEISVLQDNAKLRNEENLKINDSSDNESLDNDQNETEGIVEESVSENVVSSKSFTELYNGIELQNESINPDLVKKFGNYTYYVVKNNVYVTNIDEMGKVNIISHLIYCERQANAKLQDIHVSGNKLRITGVVDNDTIAEIYDISDINHIVLEKVLENEDNE